MTPLNGSSVTLNCSSSGSPPPHRIVFSRISGSSQTEVQDSSSSVYLIGMINFKNFIDYKAMFACVPYNTAGKGPSKNVTLDIQGMLMIYFIAELLPVNMQCKNVSFI